MLDMTMLVQLRYDDKVKSIMLVQLRDDADDLHHARYDHASIV
jgi:hypothetical protein